MGCDGLGCYNGRGDDEAVSWLATNATRQRPGRGGFEVLGPTFADEETKAAVTWPPVANVFRNPVLGTSAPLSELVKPFSEGGRNKHFNLKAKNMGFTLNIFNAIGVYQVRNMETSCDIHDCKHDQVL